MWFKVKASFGHSMTIVWARLIAFVGAMLAVVQNVAGDPSVGEAIKSLLDPKLVPVYVIGIAVVTELMRWRTARAVGPAVKDADP